MDMTIAHTIQQQIGRRAFFMLGAKNLVGHSDGLSFRVGRNAKGVTHVTVTLLPSDTYRVHFQRVWGTKVTTKADHEGVYVDSLHQIIEAETGMYTSL